MNSIQELEQSLVLLIDITRGHVTKLAEKDRNSWASGWNEGRMFAYQYALDKVRKIAQSAD